MALRRFIDGPPIDLRRRGFYEDADPNAVRASEDGTSAERIRRIGSWVRVVRLDIRDYKGLVEDGVHFNIREEREAEERRKWHERHPAISLPAPLPPVPESLKSDGKRAEEERQ